MAAELMLINPRRRRKSRRARVTHARRNPRRRRLSALQAKYFGKRKRSSRRRVIRARSNPRRRHRRHIIRARRNPVSVDNPVGFVSSELMPAAMGAVGGVVTNYIFDNYAPASFQTGILNPIGRLGLAALLGMGVAQVAGNRTGQLVAAGAMTITVFDLLNSYMSGAGLFTSSPVSGMGRIVGHGMGRLVGPGMGYMNPARQLARFA